MASRTRTLAWLGAALTCAASLAFTAAGCGGAGGVSDSKIVDALALKHSARGYEMGGDPFCTIEQLLNDSDEVGKANDQAGASSFVIAGPNGDVGVLARRPFAPNCTRRAQEALKHLERKSG